MSDKKPESKPVQKPATGPAIKPLKDSGDTERRSLNIGTPKKKG